MRKLAPAFVVTSIIALASGSALAMGDMKHKKTDANTSATPSTTSTAGDKGANSSLETSSGSMAGSSGASPSTGKSDKCAGLKSTDAKWAANKCDTTLSGTSSSSNDTSTSAGPGGQASSTAGTGAASTGQGSKGSGR
jgi:hypothetical protein